MQYGAAPAAYTAGAGAKEHGMGSERSGRLSVTFGGFEDLLSYALFIAGVAAIFFADQIAVQLGLTNGSVMGLLLIYFSALVRINALRRQLMRLQLDVQALSRKQPAGLKPSMPPGEA